MGARFTAVLLSLCLCGCASSSDAGAATPADSGTAQASVTGAELGADCSVAELGRPDADDEAIRAAVADAEAAGSAVRVSWYSPDGGGIRTAGSLEDLPAWSTSKIPLALAVTASGQGQSEADAITLALEESDNSAADTLWTSLGLTDAERADAVTGVLRAAGDSRTTVPAEQLVAGFSIFGQTQWATSDQVSFLSRLPCLDGADEVVTAMGQVDPAQAWGIGSRTGAAYKGGWGPSPAGGYTVREFGWYTNSSGQRVLVALAAQNTAGFDTATTVLGRLSAALG